MGHKTKKISKLQQRLNKTKNGAFQAITRPFTKDTLDVKASSSYREDSQYLTNIEDAEYVLKTNRAVAEVMDHKGAAIIRFANKDYREINYVNPGPVLVISADLEDLCGKDSNTIIIRASEAVVGFLNKHMPKRLHVHCEYGSQRSVGFVSVLRSLIPKRVNFYAGVYKRGVQFSKYIQNDGLQATAHLARRALSGLEDWLNSFRINVAYSDFVMQKHSYVASMSEEVVAAINHAGAVVINLSSHPISSNLKNVGAAVSYKLNTEDVEILKEKAMRLAQTLAMVRSKTIHVYADDDKTSADFVNAFVRGSRYLQANIKEKEQNSADHEVVIVPAYSPERSPATQLGHSVRMYLGISQ